MTQRKINVFYETYNSGKKVENKEVFYLEEPTFADTARARSQARAYEDDHGIEIEPDAVIIAAWTKKKPKGKRITYAEIMELRPALVMALYEQVLNAYQDIMPEGDEGKG